MTHSNDITPAAAHTPGPWDCDGRTTFYATPDDSDEICMIEVRANVTEAGWDTVAFIEAIWPGAVANARRICAAVNACEGIETGALERGIVAQQRQALAWLTTAAGGLDAAMDGATDQFDDERAELAAACRQALATLGVTGDTLEWSAQDLSGPAPDPVEASEAAMTLYNVHIYREMRLYFPGIEADTPETAAATAADKLTADAEYSEDCDGENLAALVDVAGDEEFEQSVAIDFETERLRKAAPELLEALQWFERAWRSWAEEIRRSPMLAGNTEMLRIYEAADTAIARATGRPPESDG